jgi:hypothetical protein
MLAPFRALLPAALGLLFMACSPASETISKKRDVEIAASAIVFPLRAAGRLSHFERFARRDGGWSAQSSSLWASIRANFLIQERATRSHAFPAVPAIESPRFRKIVSIHVQGGWLASPGSWRLLLGMRASLLPGLDSYGAGPIVGGRFALPRGLVGLVDVEGDYFFTSRDDRYRFTVTAQAGLGFDVRLQ